MAVYDEDPLYAGRLAEYVNQKDLFEAVEQVLVGKEKKDRIMSQEERRIVSYHEVGHALISALQKNSEPVQKITIIPRTSGALGYTMQVEEGNHYLMTREELENKIAAEKLAKPRITEEQLRFFLDRFRKLDVRQLSHRRMLIDTFINAVFLYDDKLVLTYNFREGTETITFDDLKNKLGEGFSGSDMSSVAAPKQGF